MFWFFAFFFISGFCSLLYEIVWLRLSMAQFGVTTALVSIVLSMFMAGLGLGSWVSGKLLRQYAGEIKFPTLRLYAVTELLIGLSALLVPYELVWGRNLLAHFSLSSSFAYYLASGICVALTLVPWCACMGATIPVAMLAIRQSYENESKQSFSYLYLANVLGAVVGATIPLLIIELLGFHGTLKVGAALNGLLAITAFSLTLRSKQTITSMASSALADETPLIRTSAKDGRILWLLFGTGLTSMAIEVVWIRQYTPYLGTVVYAFAMILAVYLAATFFGSRVYRRWSRTRNEQPNLIWLLLGLTVLLSLIVVDPAVQFRPQGASHYWLNLACLMVGVGPFSAILGFVTPMLVDWWSGGDPERAGRAYAVNVLGCILGPLVSGFVLLPLISERWVLFAFAIPWSIIGFLPRWSLTAQTSERTGLWRKTAYAFCLVVLVFAIKAKDFEQRFWPREVFRDNTATIIATGEGMDKHLRVNGVGITGLSPVTKMMAHLPLAFLDYPAQRTLMICFGMGTTFRSLLSWNIPTTAVELVPSVPRAFGYFHADGPELLHSPFAHLVIDDGRRYLERTTQQYDVVTLDPPPPVEAAGSSMLYSKEFYETVKQRLRPRGILQQWLPYGDWVVKASVARALKESFPYVRVFRSVSGFGYHFLASEYPIPTRNSKELVDQMPASALKDLMEWGPETTAEAQFQVVLNRELSLDQLMAQAPGAPALQDDRPENEYYLLRRSLPQPWSQLVWRQTTTSDPPRSEAFLH
jgi:predicted membrane-bound spermidine synthase